MKHFSKLDKHDKQALRKASQDVMPFSKLDKQFSLKQLLVGILIAIIIICSLEIKERMWIVLDEDQVVTHCLHAIKLLFNT